MCHWVPFVVAVASIDWIRRETFESEREGWVFEREIERERERNKKIEWFDILLNLIHMERE